MSDNANVPVEHHAVILVVDIAGTGLPESAVAEQASRMHQKLDEIIFLFDGTVTDPLSPLLIAEMPDSGKAIEAARKAIDELTGFNKRKTKADSILARIVIHSGDVRSRDLSLAGKTVEIALSVLDVLLPLQVAVSMDALEDARVVPEGEPMLKLGDASFYALPEPSPQSDEGLDTSDSRTGAAQPKPGGEKRPSSRPVAPSPPSESPGMPRWILPVIVVVAAAAITAFVMMSGKGAPESLPAPAPVPSRVVRVREPLPEIVRVAIEPFRVDVASDDLRARVEVVSMTWVEVLRPMRRIEVVSSVEPADVRVGGDIRLATPESGDAEEGSLAAAESSTASPDNGSIDSTGSGNENEERYVLVPFALVRGETIEGTEIDLESPSTALLELAGWLVTSLDLAAEGPRGATNEAMIDFIEAVRLVADSGRAENTEAVEAVVASMVSDPDFMASHYLAIDLLAENGDLEGALGALRRVVELDPENMRVTRQLADRELESGNSGAGISLYSRILGVDPNDRDALLIIGAHALAVSDEAIFRKALVRLGGASSPGMELHEPDLMNAAGDVDRAIQAYYKIESTDRENEALAFKIGRIAVLRRSTEIADLEMEKLTGSDAGFRFHMLSAYIAANAEDEVAVESSLEMAKRFAKRSDAPYTHSAEVYTVVGRTDEVVPALEMAVASGEPTLAMIENNRLFRYLVNDPRFQSLLETIQQKKAGISAAIGAAPL